MKEEQNTDYSHIPFFSALKKEQLNKLKEITRYVEISEGEVLFWEGDKADAFYILLSGEINILKVNKEGKEKILAVIEPEAFLGEMGIIEGKPRSATAQASKKSSLLAIAKEDFLFFLKTNPGIALTIIIELSKRLREANKEIQNALYLDVEARLKNVLMKLSKKESNVYRIEKKITHKDLAKMVGTSRETVTRIINKMKEKGLIIITNKYIELKETDKW